MLNYEAGFRVKRKNQEKSTQKSAEGAAYPATVAWQCAAVKPEAIKPNSSKLIASTLLAASERLFFVALPAVLATVFWQTPVLEINHN